jgi:hypothetical protein
VELSPTRNPNITIRNSFIAVFHRIDSSSSLRRPAGRCAWAQAATLGAQQSALQEGTEQLAREKQQLEEQLVAVYERRVEV